MQARGKAAAQEGRTCGRDTQGGASRVNQPLGYPQEPDSGRTGKN